VSGWIPRRKPMQTAREMYSDEVLQACIKECRAEIGRARGRREKLLGEDYARSDYIYGLESAIEIIEKVMKEGP
jgi:hypothetical protein